MSIVFCSIADRNVVNLNMKQKKKGSKRFANKRLNKCFVITCLLNTERRGFHLKAEMKKSLQLSKK